MRWLTLSLLLLLASPCVASPGPSLATLQQAQVDRVMSLLEGRTPPPPPAGVVQWTGRVVAALPDRFVLEVGPRRTLVFGRTAPRGRLVRVRGRLRQQDGVLVGVDAVEVRLLEGPQPRPAPSLQRKSGAASLAAWIHWYNPSIPGRRARAMAGWIVTFSAAQRIDPRLVVALVAAESDFRCRAVSPVGARGLGQLMPKTAVRLGVTDAFDPEQNLRGAVRYLALQLRRWGGSKALALAAYNAGPGAVKRYDGVPPYRETRQYVHYVLALYRDVRSRAARTAGLQRTDL